MQRIILNVKDKISLLDELSAGTDRKALVNKYKVSLSTISRIKRQEHEIRRKKNLNRKNSRKSDHIILEKALLKLCEQELSHRRSLNGPILMNKAKQLAKKLDRSFVPNRSWLQRFCRRNQITCAKTRHTSNLIDIKTMSDLRVLHNNCEDSSSESDDKDAVECIAQSQSDNEENLIDLGNDRKKEVFVDTLPETVSISKVSQQKKNSATKEILINLCSLRAYCYEHEIDVINSIDEIENSIIEHSKSIKVKK